MRTQHWQPIKESGDEPNKEKRKEILFNYVWKICIENARMRSLRNLLAFVPSKISARRECAYTQWRNTY